VTLSKALREGAQMFFEDRLMEAKDWIEERKGEERAPKHA
jgi:hypothetical protein